MNTAITLIASLLAFCIGGFAAYLFGQGDHALWLAVGSAMVVGALTWFAVRDEGGDG